MNTSKKHRYTLKQYTRLIIAFFGALVLLTLYQYNVLYLMRVVDSVLSVSLLLAFVHHMGYASFAGLMCVPIFNFLENWRPKSGFRVVVGILLLLLIIETLLTGYYILYLNPLGLLYENLSTSLLAKDISTSWVTVVSTFVAMVLIMWLFRIIYLFTKKHYHHIAGMYPFTIILFTVFVATLFLDGKPINQNKTQYLVNDVFEKSRKEDKNQEINEFKNDEIVWINSVFNGKNKDNAYLTAKDLAYDKEFEKSLLLGRYILSKVPDHVDTKILMGRVNAWNKEYSKSINILKAVVNTNPDYIDAYAALFDVYYWAGRTDEAYELIENLKTVQFDTSLIDSKIQRAEHEYLKDKMNTDSDTKGVAHIEDE